MIPITELISFILHIDKYLSTIIQTYDSLTYVFLFLIVFLETGIVLTPFLPGDSLLFATGSFAAIGALNIWILFIVLTTAAILGDTVNYAIGYYLGPKVFKKENARILKREYLERTNNFYTKYGKKTIVLARFVPIIRTFAPFIAGIGKMNYWQFLKFNVIGAILWVALFTFSGYFFGTIPIVRENFSIVIIIIIIASIIPLVIEILRSRKRQEPKRDFTPISLR
ncbi:MAG: DedA family protein [bacterium]|nr:DedA family protein [bacterium]